MRGQNNKDNCGVLLCFSRRGASESFCFCFCFCFFCCCWRMDSFCTQCSRSWHLRQQQLCPHASLLPDKLKPPLEAVHGSAQSPNGAGTILAGPQQVLASLLRAMSASVSKAPRPLFRVQHGQYDDGCF